MALVHSPYFFEIALAVFFGFFVALREFTTISLCLYSARSPHSLIPCLLTDQNFKNNSEFLHVCIVQKAPIHQSHTYRQIKILRTIFEKGLSRNISMRLFQNLTNSFREDILQIYFCSYSQVAPIHQSYVNGQIKLSLTFLREVTQVTFL